MDFSIAYFITDEIIATQCNHNLEVKLHIESIEDNNIYTFSLIDGYETFRNSFISAQTC